jgi:hypothetical protein
MGIASLNVAYAVTPEYQNGNWLCHYEDILEKRNGEWRTLARKTMINQK